MIATPSLSLRRAAGLGLLATATLLAGLAGAPRQGLADEVAMLVPGAIVYPGQPADAPSLEARSFRIRADLAGDYVVEKEQLSGKLARRTLLPGKPIRLADLKGADVVAAGKPVTLVYREAGMTITGLGTALQSAGEGEDVRAKNVDSGLIVSGVAKADGSVEIGG